MYIMVCVYIYIFPNQIHNINILYLYQSHGLQPFFLLLLFVSFHGDIFFSTLKRSDSPEPEEVPVNEGRGCFFFTLAPKEWQVGVTYAKCLGLFGFIWMFPKIVVPPNHPFQ